MTAHVRNLLEMAADRVTGEVPAAPVDDVVAAGRDRVRRRRRRVLTGAAAAAVAVVAGALAIPRLASPGDPAALLGGGRSEDMVCGGVRFDRADLPGRPLRKDDRFVDRASLADLLWLDGWPRAVPLDAAEWTVLAGRGDALLVARMPSGEMRYLPVVRERDGSWTPNPPCTPRQRR